MEQIFSWRKTEGAKRGPQGNFGDNSVCVLRLDRMAQERYTIIMAHPWRNLRHTLAALTANCGDFNAAWDRAAAAAGQERWEGEWRSEVNAHHGALRCLLQQVDEAGFQAFFHARYARWLRVCYRTSLKAQRAGGGWRLEGQADLGALAGGVYVYRGELTAGKLLCSYECSYDRGVFDLRRLQ